MREIYELALQHDLPITTHCTIGTVRQKYRLPTAERVHPIKGPLPNLKTSKYQQYFTHPLNYECLLNQPILSEIWGKTAPDYRNLKICIGHWGSASDWLRYLENDWADLYDRTRHEDCPALDLRNWYTDPKEAYKNFTWFTIICELIKSDSYPNIYTDISYTLHEPRFLPMLKMVLESSQKIKERVLFGTDFYMVSKAISEREYSINIRAYLGKELFDQIAIINARRFLSNKLYPVAHRLHLN
jgi:predicted TIM-barrel fold metal-dependent hydrolase